MNPRALREVNKPDNFILNPFTPLGPPRAELSGGKSNFRWKRDFLLYLKRLIIELSYK